MEYWSLSSKKFSQFATTVNSESACFRSHGCRRPHRHTQCVPCRQRVMRDRLGMDLQLQRNVEDSRVPREEWPDFDIVRRTLRRSMRICRKPMTDSPRESQWTAAILVVSYFAKTQLTENLRRCSQNYVLPLRLTAYKTRTWAHNYCVKTIVITVEHINYAVRLTCSTIFHVLLLILLLMLVLMFYDHCYRHY